MKMTLIAFIKPLKLALSGAEGLALSGAEGTPPIHRGSHTIILVSLLSRLKKEIRIFNLKRIIL